MVRNRSSRLRWTLVGLLMAAFAVRVYALQAQSLWRDEVDAVYFATRDWATLLSMFTRPGENGPLYFLLLRPWIGLFGSSEFAVRYFSLMFGVAAVALIYPLGRRLLPVQPSLLGTLLLCFSPYMVWYSQETKMYALLLCLSILSTWFLLRALQGAGRLNWLGYVVVTTLSLYIHILTVALLPFQFLVFLLGGARFRSHWRGALLAFSSLILPYLPLARWEIPTILSSFETGHPFYTPDAMLRILFQALAFGLRTPSIIELALFVFILLSGTFLFSRRRFFSISFQSCPQCLLWLYLLVPVLTVYLISLGMPIFTDRYLIAIAPAFYLLLGCGLYAVKSRSQLLFGVCLVGILVVDAQGLWMQSHTAIKADFRSAAHYYSEHAIADDLLLAQMPYVHRNFQYYYQKPYHQGDGLYTNKGMTAEQVDAEMSALTRAYATVWLLKSEAEMWDRRGLVEEWLRLHGQLSLAAQFQLVTVYRFTLH